MPTDISPVFQSNICAAIRYVIINTPHENSTIRNSLNNAASSPDFHMPPAKMGNTIGLMGSQSPTSPSENMYLPMPI